MKGMRKKISEYYPFLEDIRRRLHSLVIAFVIFFFVGFFNSGQILKLIVRVFKVENANIVTTSPFQFFDLAMSVGIYTGLILCTPVFLYHVYGFLKDGLNHNEKKFFFLLLPLSGILFCTGFLYSFSILYFTLNSIATFNISLGIQNLWDISKFLLQIIATSALLGLVFQFPLILTFFIKMGMVDTQFLKGKRRHAVALMFILTALLPPTDGLSLLVMVLPLVIIYEGTIQISSFLEKKTRKMAIAETQALMY